MKGRKLEKKRVLLSQLKEFPNNPNVHPEEQVKALAQSMEQYGQYYPIVVDEDFMVLCGHGKKKALDYMGEKEADVTVMYGLSDKQKKKLLLEDNKIQDMSYVSFGDVERIIKEIGEVDIIGYTPEYLDAIINEISPDNMGVHFDEPAKKLYSRMTGRESSRTCQRVYQILVAGDPKKRSYRAVLGDLYRERGGGV